MSLSRTERVHIVEHGMATHVLSRIRRKEADHSQVHDGLAELGRICGYEIVDEFFETKPTEIETPLCETEVDHVPDIDDVVLVSLLRGSLPFVEGLREVFPRARDGMVRPERESEVRRDDGTFPMAVDYQKLPPIDERDTVVVADPMMATGSSICTTLEAVTDVQPNPRRLVVLTAIASPLGVDHVSSTYPDVDLVAVSIDDRLDEETGYIVPGLGDAGDRAHGTQSRRVRMERTNSES